MSSSSLAAVVVVPAAVPLCCTGVGGAASVCVRRVSTIVAVTVAMGVSTLRCCSNALALVPCTSDLKLARAAVSAQNTAVAIVAVAAVILAFSILPYALRLSRLSWHINATHNKLCRTNTSDSAADDCTRSVTAFIKQGSSNSVCVARTDFAVC
eukprot:13960-Heterococcus_DN1.PRE.1